jgi:hypothetical protein
MLCYVLFFVQFPSLCFIPWRGELFGPSAFLFSMTILVFPEVKPVTKHFTFFHFSSQTLSSQYLLTISCSHPLLLVILAPSLPLFNKPWLMQFFLLSRVQSWGT